MPGTKAQPDCPRSDKMSAFYGLAYGPSEMYVKIHSNTDACQRLITVNGVNYSTLVNFSRTCGPLGEYKRRIAEELSAMMFQGGLEWPRSENETIEVVTEEGTFQLEISEAKYAELEACWTAGCGCEQVKNPTMRLVLYALMVIAVGGLGADGFKYLWDMIKGKKPPKRVECKKGHRIAEVKFAYSHRCDICGASGTAYQCNAACNYDLCKKCYKETKKKVKVAWAEWCEKHPEDKKKGKDADKEDEDEDEKEEKKKSESGDDKSGDDKADGASEPEESGAEAKSGGSSGDADKDE